jgi:hypothetical protein
MWLGKDLERGSSGLFQGLLYWHSAGNTGRFLKNLSQEMPLLHPALLHHVDFGFRYQRFGGTYCLRVWASGTLKPKVVFSAETFISVCKSTRRCNPQDEHRHLYRRENLRLLFSQNSRYLVPDLNVCFPKPVTEACWKVLSRNLFGESERSRYV